MKPHFKYGTFKTRTKGGKNRREKKRENDLKADLLQLGLSNDSGRYKSWSSVTVWSKCHDVGNLQASWPASLIGSGYALITKGFMGFCLGGLVLKL